MSDPLPVDLSEPARDGPQQIPRPPKVRRSPGPWWARPGAAVPAALPVAAVREALAVAAGRDPVSGRDPASGDGGVRRLRSVELPSTDPRPAAVLCALFDDERGQAEVVLTRRAAHLRSHTGEVSFPGGRLDPGERPVDAALREAREEIGLDPAGVEIIGQLSPLATATSRASITPFVGILARRPTLHPNPGEVARAFTVPLVELVAPGTYHEERWDGVVGLDRPINFFDLLGETVWGATAHVLRELLDLLLPDPG